MMFALVDGTAFYCSCEKQFAVHLRNKPVVVASNNDGVIVAVCPIARKLGLKKFAPIFQQAELIKKTGTTVFSSNYELYGAISGRMHDTLAGMCDRQFRYSIDESFLLFDRNQECWLDFGRYIRRALWDNLRIPTGVGFGQTLTLAKVANHAAKRLPGFRGVCVVSDANREQILSQMSAQDVWGIGSRLAARLKLYNVNSALDLARQSPDEMQRVFNVNVARTVKELNGIPSLFFDDVRPDKKQIFSTRTFGQRVCDIDELSTALATHAFSVTKKARRQKSMIVQLMMFATAGSFDTRNTKSAVITFPSPTDCYTQVAEAVKSKVNELFDHRLLYMKCGVGAIELAPASHFQNDLFAPRIKRGLSDVVDVINSRYGSAITIGSAITSNNDDWQMRRQMLSPAYLTSWSALPVIQCK